MNEGSAGTYATHRDTQNSNVTRLFFRNTPSFERTEESVAQPLHDPLPLLADELFVKFLAQPLPLGIGETFAASQEVPGSFFLSLGLSNYLVFFGSKWFHSPISIIEGNERFYAFFFGRRYRFQDAAVES